jgi:probable F420-dependent oxidoreductase
MEIEVVLPDESPAMPPETLVALAEAAERLGYRTAYLPDHLLPPEPYGDTYGGVYEPLVTLAHLAAHTSSIRLGTSVLVLPMRSPFVVAKQVATLDRLSGGRTVLGMGAGWDRTEFAAVGADFATRGARLDEGIALIRHLFDGGGPFDGPTTGDHSHRFVAGVFAPLPERPVPIMVGGTTDRALRRAAELADEWQGVGLAPAEFAGCVARLRELTDRPLRVGTRLAWDGTRTVDEAHALAAAGADAVAIWFGPADGAAGRMAEFAAAVRP